MLSGFYHTLLLNAEAVAFNSSEVPGTILRRCRYCEMHDPKTIATASKRPNIVKHDTILHPARFNPLAPGTHDILEVTFSKSSYRIVAWALEMKLLCRECHRTPLMRNQHWLWLGDARKKAFFANCDPIYVNIWCNFARLLIYGFQPLDIHYISYV